MKTSHLLRNLLNLQFARILEGILLQEIVQKQVHSSYLYFYLLTK